MKQKHGGGEIWSNIKVDKREMTTMARFFFLYALVQTTASNTCTNRCRYIIQVYKCVYCNAVFFFSTHTQNKNY